MQRKISRRLAGATAGLLLTATSALAAEPLPLPPPPPPVFSWAGIELGVHVGGGVGRTSVDFPEAIVFARFPVSNSYSDSGVFGGVHVGYNLQLMGPIVAGLQLEYNFAGITGSTSRLGNFERTDVAEFGSADGRLGVAFDRVLIYGIGGFAYGDIRNQINCGVLVCGAFIPPTVLGGTPITRDFAANRFGYDVGGGIEYNLMGNITVRAEYRYYNWGSLGFADAGFGAFVFPFNPANPFAIAIPNHRDREILHTGRIGLTYHFAWPPAPVVAKY
jgi:outer membrane immunogenic protein